MPPTDGNPNRLSLSAGVCLALLLVLTASCGGNKPNRPETLPVRGTVTLDGKPVEDALVTFQLVDGSRSSVGRTDRHGCYTLTTFVPGDGAQPGEYRVQIVKYPPFDPADAPPEKYDLQSQGQTPTEPRSRKPAAPAVRHERNVGLEGQGGKGRRQRLHIRPDLRHAGVAMNTRARYCNDPGDWPRRAVGRYIA